MTQPAKSQEPSMEEILASIRRIIADDDAGKRGPGRAKDGRAGAKAGAPSEPLGTTMPGPSTSYRAVRGTGLAANPRTFSS